MPRIEVVGFAQFNSISWKFVLDFSKNPSLQNVCTLKKEVYFRSKVIMMHKLPALKLC